MILVIGMLIAFLAGAWVRKPFVTWKKKEDVTAVEKENAEELKRIKDLEKQQANLLAYAGKAQEDDE